jgi:NTP pyrophosphatase (non-canonical NTP hydrolase)
MENLNHHGKPMAKSSFDESKLTDEQKNAVAIARAQGVSFTRKFEDLCTDLTSEEADELAEAIEKNREADLQALTKSLF